MGSHIYITENHVDTQKAKTLSTLNKLTAIWTSNLPDKLKWQLLRSFESGFVYSVNLMDTNLQARTFTRLEV